MNTVPARFVLAAGLAGLAAFLPGRAVAAPADDAARARLSAACDADGRSPVDKPRFVFAAGPERAAAVEALSKQLGATVERIDVHETVSKYIGETEKNLDRLARPDAQSAAVLFFDEADALFAGGAGASPETVAAVTARLAKANAGRVVVLGLNARPAVGRLGKSALAALPGAATAPWVALCGGR